MLVTQSIESNVNILANSPTAENISSILKCMPFNHYRCQDITDAFMIPCFILILDGHVLTKDNLELDLFECFLTEWSGRMKKCLRCWNYRDCLKSTAAAKDIDIGVDYKTPVVLLHADKRQRDVEGLVALTQPMPVNEPFSLELEYWLRSKCLAWHKKALRWRKKNELWITIECQKDSCKKKKFSKIASERWMPREITIKLNGPEFE
jgi:hypothetical protein